MKNKKGYNNKRTETNTRIKELNSIKELIAKNSYGKANAELIRYFCNYAEDFGTEYYENSRSTAYYSGIYYLLTENLTCGKTRTK